MEALITTAVVIWLLYVGVMAVIRHDDPRYTSNCRYCGKRKKFQRGWLLWGTDTRYTTCRSCGAEDA